MKLKVYPPAETMRKKFAWLPTRVSDSRWDVVADCVVEYVDEWIWLEWYLQRREHHRGRPSWRGCLPPTQVDLFFELEKK